MSGNELPALIAACRAVLASSGPIEVAEEYGYASLPLCVIDSVFSIGVRYEGVRNVVERYCRRFGLPKQSPKGTVPLRIQQESITGFLVRVVPMYADRLATEVPARCAPECRRRAHSLRSRVTQVLVPRAPKLVLSLPL